MRLGHAMFLGSIAALLTLAENRRGAHLVCLQRLSAGRRRHLDAIALPGSRSQACGAAEVRIEERRRRNAVSLQE